MAKFVYVFYYISTWLYIAMHKIETITNFFSCRDTLCSPKPYKLSVPGRTVERARN